MPSHSRLGHNVLQAPVKPKFGCRPGTAYDEDVIAHAFHHNAFFIVSNGDRARYGSITSKWGHFAEWKRLDEVDKGRLDAEVLLNGMLAHDRLLDKEAVAAEVYSHVWQQAIRGGLAMAA